MQHRNSEQIPTMINLQNKKDEIATQGSAQKQDALSLKRNDSQDHDVHFSPLKINEKDAMENLNSNQVMLNKFTPKDFMEG